MSDTTYPQNWLIAKDFDPNEHLISLKGRDYLNVQNRLLWFIRDQRALIAAGLATTSYVIKSELVQLDREAGWAHFYTYVRDVLGNEATMYGSESMKDFNDYIEKASTKSLGRALLALGYGTAFAPEIDEGVRVVDAPVERAQPRQTAQPAQKTQPQAQTSTPVQNVQKAKAEANKPASPDLLNRIADGCKRLGKPVPSVSSAAEGEAILFALREEYAETQKANVN